MIIINNKEFNQLNQEEKDYLTIIALTLWRYSDLVSEEEFKNYIKYNPENKTVELISQRIRDRFTDIYDQMPELFTDNEKLPANFVLSLDTFVKYNVTAMKKLNSDEEISFITNYLSNKDNICKA